MPDAAAVTKSLETPVNAYRAHRERQRRRILDAAERLFDERGISRVTMAEITAASGLRASTLYEYFSNKEKIVWGILGDFFVEGAAHVKERTRAGTGLEKITRLLEHMADELSANRARVRFMAQFDALYARHWQAERLLSLEAQVSDEGCAGLTALVREGIGDGSLRPELDPDLTMHAVLNAVIASQRRLAALGDKVEVEYGQPVDRLLREVIRILVLGLAAPVKGEEPTVSKTPAANEIPTKRSSL